MDGFLLQCAGSEYITAMQFVNSVNCRLRGIMENWCCTYCLQY